MSSTWQAYPYPAFLVGTPAREPVTDAAPIRDFDTGYRPAAYEKIPASGAWKEGEDPGERQFAYLGSFTCENGGTIPSLTLAYETWGTLNADASNAILLCHALTGDSHAASSSGAVDEGWWGNIVGPGLAIDTDKYFVVCPNVLGGCQGSTGPASIGPTGHEYGPDFPTITIRDMVESEALLADYLGISSWLLVAGASFGGNRVMEWAASYPHRVRSIAVLVAGPASTAEQIAYAHFQIQAILADPAFRSGHYYDAPDGAGPAFGLGLARQIAHVTYRCSSELDTRFGRTPQAGEDPYSHEYERFAIQSYLDYHANKLARRFDANSYIRISQAFNTHDIGRGRGGVDAVLATLTMPALVVAVDSDRLFYPESMAELAEKLPGCTKLYVVHSDHGHDGFLIENDQVSAIFREFFSQQLEFTE